MARWKSVMRFRPARPVSMSVFVICVQTISTAHRCRKPFDEEVKRAIFLLFLRPPLEYMGEDPQLNPDNYRHALTEAAYCFYSDPIYADLQDELIHETLIYKFAKEYAETVCLKNGV